MRIGNSRGISVPTLVSSAWSNRCEHPMPGGERQTGERISRRTILAAACGLLLPHWRQSTSGSEVTVDAEGARVLLRWALADAPGDPPPWRDLAPYKLAREQAKWNGAQSPDLDVERQLSLIADLKRRQVERAEAARAAAFTDQIVRGAAPFLERAVPHLRGYLPAATPLRATIALGVFLPNYAFSMDTTLVISITDRFWQNDPNRVFNLTIHEMFHLGYIRHQQGRSPMEAADGAALLRALQWAVQNEGLATYVAYRARPTGLALNDYRLLENTDEVRARFARCRALMDDMRRPGSAGLGALRQRLNDDGNVGRVTYVVGATMAARIEAKSGRGALVDTIVRGPQAFVDAYRATTPDADLMV